MKKLLLVAPLLLLLLAGGAQAQAPRISNAAGTVKGTFTDITVPNGTITKTGSRTFSLTFTGPVLSIKTGTASLDFAAWAGTDCQDLTITVTGAVSGDVVALGVPTALASTAAVFFTGFVSAADTVTVRGCKVSAGASANPAAATVRATVFQH